MAAPKMVDWVSARKDYLEDRSLSYTDIANKYGVSRTVVGERAKAEGWTDARRSIDEKSIKRVEAEIVDRNAEVNDLHYNLAVGMASLANKELNIAHRQLDKLEQELGKDGIGINDKRLISPYKMKALFESMAIAMNLQRVALGLPTSVERKQVTNRDNKDFFGTDNYDELLELMSDTLVALQE